MLVDIYSKLQHKMGYNNINKFSALRSDIFNCCCLTFRPFNKLSVKLSDCEGVTEGAVDKRGPTRE